MCVCVCFCRIVYAFQAIYNWENELSMQLKMLRVVFPLLFTCPYVVTLYWLCISFQVYEHFPTFSIRIIVIVIMISLKIKCTLQIYICFDVNSIFDLKFKSLSMHWMMSSCFVLPMMFFIYETFRMRFQLTEFGSKSSRWIWSNAIKFLKKNFFGNE